MGWVQQGAALGRASGVDQETLRAAYLRHSDFGDAAAELLATAERSGPLADRFRRRARLRRDRGRRERGGAHRSADRAVRRRPPPTRLASSAGSPPARRASACGRACWRRRSRPPSTRTSRPCGGPTCSPARSARRRSWRATAGWTRPPSTSAGRSGSCSPRRWPMPPRSCDASATRHGSRTSTTASAPSSTWRRTAPSGSSAATSTTSRARFPEIAEAAAALTADAPLAIDGELVPWRQGSVLDFASLQTRLGRVRPSAELLAEVPVVLVAFDLLHAGGAGPARDPAPGASGAPRGARLCRTGPPSGSCCRTSRAPDRPMRSSATSTTRGSATTRA